MIAEKVAWQAWNIVEGPKSSIRVDDPGSDYFDDFSCADPENFHRYEVIGALYHALVDVVNYYNMHRTAFLNENEMKAMSTILSGPVLQAQQNLTDESLVMFNAEHWRRYEGYGTSPSLKELPGKAYYLLRKRRINEK